VAPSKMAHVSRRRWRRRKADRVTRLLLELDAVARARPLRRLPQRAFVGLSR